MDWISACGVVLGMSCKVSAPRASLLAKCITLHNNNLHSHPPIVPRLDNHKVYKAK